MKLVSLARNPVPNGGVVGTFEGYDGAPLRFARWAATRGPRRGTVCCFPGRSEYIEKYFETIGDLRRRGFAVAIFDWRGQGGSYRPINDPRKGHIEDYSEYDRDLACFMRQIVLPDCPPPYTALGHSLGGHIVLRNITTQSSWFDRVVLIAPMIRLHPDILGFPESLVSLYAAVFCGLGLGRTYVQGGGSDIDADTKFDGNSLTSDRERFERNKMLDQASPELLLGSPTVSWLNATLRSIRMINQPGFSERIMVPTLTFAPGRDTIVLPRAIEDFVARLKSGTGVLLAQSRHEILQENDDIRARFWAAFDAYLGVDLPEVA